MVHQAKVTVLAELVPPDGSAGNPFPCLFQLPKATHTLWLDPCLISCRPLPSVASFPTASFGVLSPLTWTLVIASVVLQSFSCVWLFGIPWTTEHQASLSFTIFWNLLKLMSIESVMPCSHLILCHPLLLLPSIFPSSRVFSSELAICIRCQSIGASASVLPMNTQGWFPLGLTGMISLLSKGLSRVFSSATIQKHQFVLSLLYGPTLTSVRDYWKNHSFDYTDLCQQSNVSAF